MLLRRLLTWVWKWGRKSHFVAMIVNALPYGTFWNLGGFTERAAMYSQVLTTSSEMFDQLGKASAERFKKVANPDQVALDFGCGIGRMERFLADYCKEIHGVDVSGVRIRLAKKRHRGYDNVYFHKNNGRDMSVNHSNTFHMDSSL